MHNDISGAAGLSADARQLADELDDPALRRWRRSSRCGAAGSCVEIADLPAGGKAVRDGKLGDASAALVFTREEWLSFLAGVRAGEFD